MVKKISKQEAGYKEAPPNSSRRCGVCSMYRDGKCTLVTGSIDADDTCKYFEPKKKG